jgi:hypothetical protein
VTLSRDRYCQNKGDAAFFQGLRPLWISQFSRSQPHPRRHGLWHPSLPTKGNHPPGSPGTWGQSRLFGRRNSFLGCRLGGLLRIGLGLLPVSALSVIALCHDTLPHRVASRAHWLWWRRSFDCTDLPTWNQRGRCCRRIVTGVPRSGQGISKEGVLLRKRPVPTPANRPLSHESLLRLG